MAFVNLTVEGFRQGTATDIDGRFSLTPKQAKGTLLVSFVGYKTRQIQFSTVTGALLIKLTSTAANLSAVVVRPIPNPAHTSIARVLANRAKNNPENLPSFRYNDYTKIYATPATGAECQD